MNNISHIISDVNITGDINVELYIKHNGSTVRRPGVFFYHDEDAVVNGFNVGHGFYNIEFIEYD